MENKYFDSLSQEEAKRSQDYTLMMLMKNDQLCTLDTIQL